MQLISSTSVTAESKSLQATCRGFINGLLLPITKSQQEYGRNKKGTLMECLFYSCHILTRLTVLISCFALLSACEAKPRYQYEQVKWIYDGDTLQLKDGRKIRVIGIDAPELAHYKKKAEPLGAKATEQLRQRLNESNNNVRLEFDDAAKDRYKRTLAHVFFTDGSNLSTWLLQKGLANTMIFPPNIRYASDYKKVQQSAQEKQLGIWKLKNFQLFTPKSLSQSHTGFTRLQGKIKKVQHRRNVLFLELDNKIFIKIGQRYIKYFDTYHPKQLLHQQITVSGDLKKYQGKRTITVRHPLQIDRPKRTPR